MKYPFKQLVKKIQDFLTGHDKADDTIDDSLTSTIEQAVNRKLAVHIIFAETSFTGDIIKYDTDRDQLIIKNFDKNVTRIIRISDIKRIRFVPSTIRTAQKNRFKKE